MKSLAMRLDGTGNPVELAKNKDVLDTGLSMSDCIRTIVLFNFSGGSYLNARGYHAGGGIDNTNWKALFEGVPNTEITQIHVITGTYNYMDHRKKMTEETIREEAKNYGLDMATIKVHHVHSHASADRFGQVSFF